MPRNDNTTLLLSSPPVWFLAFCISSVVIGGHIGWIGHERSAVERRLALVRERGEPVAITDLVEPELADDVNAVAIVRRAAAAIDKSAAREQIRDTVEEARPESFTLPLTADEVAIVREALSANAPALRELDALANARGAAWRLVGKAGMSRMFDTRPELRGSRALANLLADEMRRAITDGDAAAALRRLPQCDALAATIATHRSLVASLISVGIHALSTAVTLESAVGLDATDPAVRVLITERIVWLLDDKPIRQSWRDGLLGERVDMLGMLDLLIDGTYEAAAQNRPRNGRDRALGMTMAPLVYRGEATILDYQAEALAINDAPSMAAFNARAARLRQIESAARDDVLNPFAKIMLPSIERYTETHFRLMTDRHLAAVALAARLYRIDHGGELPLTLEALVPQYLPAVPIDAIDGRPLRYDAARAIVWGVGENGVDDGGQEPLPPPASARESLAHADRVVRLKPR